jgi:hypothetical protein
MQTIGERIAVVNERIRALEKTYHRAPHSVKLLLATKSRTVSEIEEAIDAGVRAFGENYVQEALPKIEALASRNIEWHFIGPIQANKTKWIAEHFSWAQSVDRVKTAERLHAQHPSSLPPLQVCIEVNANQEESKSGVKASEVLLLAQKIASLPNLKFRGLMAIPEAFDDIKKQRESFRSLKGLFEKLRTQGFDLDTLSMGMSDDYEAAIAEGSTLIRLGTAIFGERN